MLKKLFNTAKHHTTHRFYDTGGVTKSQMQSHWMPFTGNREFEENPRIIVSAKGRYLIAADGRKIFDGLSGLWTTGLGLSLIHI